MSHTNKQIKFPPNQQKPYTGSCPLAQDVCASYFHQKKEMCKISTGKDASYKKNQKKNLKFASKSEQQLSSASKLSEQIYINCKVVKLGHLHFKDGIC